MAGVAVMVRDKYAVRLEPQQKESSSSIWFVRGKVQPG